jgi:hypothetical protein
MGRPQTADVCQWRSFETQNDSVTILLDACLRLVAGFRTWLGRSLLTAGCHPWIRANPHGSCALLRKPTRMYRVSSNPRLRINHSTGIKSTAQIYRPFSAGPTCRNMLVCPKKLACAACLDIPTQWLALMDESRIRSFTNLRPVASIVLRGPKTTDQTNRSSKPRRGEW